MKCNTWVIDRTIKKSGNTKRNCVAGIRTLSDPDVDRVVDLNKFAEIPGSRRRCDGEVTVSLYLFDSPDWGGVSPELDIVYKCSKCKCIFYPDLPQSVIDLEVMLNEYLKSRE